MRQYCLPEAQQLVDRNSPHWGGDCWSDYESMAESLRGGLSLTMSGFGYWSHDIGGFEHTLHRCL